MPMQTVNRCLTASLIAVAGLSVSLATAGTTEAKPKTEPVVVEGVEIEVQPAVVEGIEIEVQPVVVEGIEIETTTGGHRVGDEVVVVGKYIEPEKTKADTETRTITIVHNNDDHEVRVKVVNDDRVVWLDGNKVDDAYVVHAGNVLKIMDERGKVVAEVKLPEAPPSPVTVRGQRRVGALPAHPAPVSARSVRSGTFPLAVRSEARALTPGQGAQPGAIATTNRVIMGITMSSLSPALRAQIGLDADEAAVLIDSVLDGYPADRAGMRPFDIVLGHDESSLVRAIAKRSAGDTMELVIVRGGDEMEIEVEFASSRRRPGARGWVERDREDGAQFVFDVERDEDHARRPAVVEGFELPDGFATWFRDNEEIVENAMEQAMNAFEEFDFDDKTREEIRERVHEAMSQLHKHHGGAIDMRSFFGDLEELEEHGGQGNLGFRVFDPERGNVLTFPGQGRLGSLHAEQLEAQAERLEDQFERLEEQLDRIEERIDGRLDALTERMEHQMNRIEHLLNRIDR